MFAVSPEKNRHRKSDDGSETDPPGKFHGGQPIRLHVSDTPENSGDPVQQIANDGNEEKADDHCENIAQIAAASLSEHSTKKHAKEWTVGVSENAQNNWENANVGMKNKKIKIER